jgi:hypothetical protein
LGFLFVCEGLLRTDDENSHSSKSRQSQSVGPPVISSARNNDASSSSGTDYVNTQNNKTWKRTGSETVSFTIV